MKKNLKEFVEAGYKKKSDAKNINGYILDEELSTKRNKVYYDPKTGKAVHTIAGTDSMTDWSNNLLIPIGMHEYSNRYKNSEQIQKEANKKYGKTNVDLVTHSQSGNIAENLANKGLVGGNNTTLNPAIIGSHNKDVKVVKSVLDPVSALTNTTKNDVKIIPKTLDPIAEHSTNILDKTKDSVFKPVTDAFQPVTDAAHKTQKKFNKMFGFGLETHENIQSVLFKRPEWTLAKAKTWLKKHKFKTDVDEKPNHYRFRQFEPYLFKKYITKPIITKTLNGDKNENIEFIIGIKSKPDNKIMKYRSEDESEASSSEEENEHTLRGGALKEKAIVNKIIKLTQQIQDHHLKHGVKPSIIKGFKILGKGIIDSASPAVEPKKGPSKAQLKKMMDDSMKPAVMPMDYVRPSKFKGGELFSTAGFQKKGGNDGMTKEETRAAKDNEKYTNAEAMKDTNKSLAIYNKGGYNTKKLGFGIRGCGPNERFRESQKGVTDQDWIDAFVEADRKVNGRGASGKMLKNAAVNSTAGVLNSAANRAMYEMDNRGKKGSGLKKGSQAAKDHMARIRAMRKTK
jgi:hypothetical protein